MSTSNRRNFGSGLNPILGKKVFPETPEVHLKKLLNVMVQNVFPGEYQPRTEFDPIALDELASSIKSQGIIQPLVVREVGIDRYEIIAGERRWRAAQMAGLQQVPVIISKISNEEALAFGLIENIQRKDLNPIDEAVALKRLIDEFGMTHEQVSKSVGKSRTSVSNTLRLLKLSSFAKNCLSKKQIEVGHAKSIITMSIEKQDKICQEIINNKYTVRDVEKISKTTESISKIKKGRHAETDNWEKRIKHLLQMDVALNINETGSGKIIIKVKDAFQIEQFIDSLS